jgi:hypothetical protein
MPYQTIPGTNTRWRPGAEALADPEMHLVQMADGSYQGYRKDFGTKLGSAMRFIVPAMMGYGALASSGALGSAAAGTGGGSGAGAAGAAGGVLPSSNLSGNALLAATQATPGAIASQGVSAGIPLGGIAASAGAGAAGAAGGGASAAGGIGNALKSALTSSDGLGALASLIPMLMAARGGGDGGGVGNISQSMPQLNRMLDMSVQRAERTDPLHQMVTRLAEQRMPIRSRG